MTKQKRTNKSILKRVQRAERDILKISESLLKISDISYERRTDIIIDQIISDINLAVMNLESLERIYKEKIKRI